MPHKSLAIVVGGGPAPGINGVIAAAAIEAIKRGLTVYGISYGFSQLQNGDCSGVRKLSIADVSHIHSDGGSILGTSRANPTKSPELLANVVNALHSLEVSYLVTIGGDDTANSARVIAEAAAGSIKVVHVPKTIDNDLPLPGFYSTFGFQTARAVGTEIVETLILDATTTSRWYLVVAMGRKAGHLALGIGFSAGAALTIIGEDFAAEHVSLDTLSRRIVGSILKRMAEGIPHGVVVLAEGLAEKITPESIPELSDAERDPHGHIRYVELDIARIIKNAVKKDLKQLGVSMTVVDKNVGYELRCHQPNAFDREYTRELGFAAVDLLLSGGNEAMISRQGDNLCPIPFKEMIDPLTGKTQVRLVDTNSSLYTTAQHYMIRVEPSDCENQKLLNEMAAKTTLKADQLVEFLKPGIIT